MEKSMFLVICLAAVLLSAGCNSPQGGANDANAVKTTKLEDKPAAAQDAPAASKPSGGAMDDVANLFSGRPAQYMVEYAMTTDVNGDQSKGTYAYFFRGEQSRMDISMDGLDSKYYMNKDGAVMCTKQEGQWTCMKLQDAQSQPSQKDPAQDMDELKKNIEANKATRLPDRVIAGVTCKCFNTKITINMPNAKETGMSEIDTTYCVSPEGIPLYSESTTQSMHTVQEATRAAVQIAASSQQQLVGMEQVGRAIAG